MNKFHKVVLPSILSCSVEDGMTHYIENELKECLTTEYNSVFVTVESMIKKEVAGTADILHLFSRLPLSNIPDGYYLASIALSAKNEHIRESAVRMIDSWGGQVGRILLESHNECVGYIDRYIQSVLKDLKI